MKTLIALRTAFFKREEIEKLLTVCALFSCALAVLRVIHTGHSMHIFLIWNLFLAYIPYVLSKYLQRRPQQPVVTAIGFIAWLLFIPNSFYILTDLFHLPENGGAVPQWFDLILILSFAWNGLLLGMLSIRHMEKLVGGSNTLRVHEWLFIYPIMWLNALGVYTGRYLRYNSWDIVSNPFRLLYDIIIMILHPFTYRAEWSMIFCFSILFTLMYLMMKRVGAALR